MGSAQKKKKERAGIIHTSISGGIHASAGKSWRKTVLRLASYANVTATTGILLPLVNETNNENGNDTLKATSVP